MIGFLGGTGPEGRGLALRLALAGEDVIIGSRAAAAAEEVAGLAPGAVVEGALNEETAARADVVFIAVPYSAQRTPTQPDTSRNRPAGAPLRPPVIDGIEELDFLESSLQCAFTPLAGDLKTTKTDK